uniref:hypothetical protein n=1 Tax=Hymenobacter sp. BT730 TaxID=3063332 RepID=UPI0026DF9749
MVSSPAPLHFRTAYVLNVKSSWQGIAAHRKQHSKARASAARRLQQRGGEPGTPPPSIIPPTGAVLLCASKMRTLDTILRLAMNQALRESHAGPFPAKEIRLTTTQAGLAITCDCSVRTLQRHLEDLHTLGYIKVRQQLQRGFQLVLTAPFLDWTEVQVPLPAPVVSPPAPAPAVAPTPRFTMDDLLAS